MVQSEDLEADVRRLLARLVDLLLTWCCEGTFQNEQLVRRVAALRHVVRRSNDTI